MKNTTKRALYVIAALLAALFVLACLAGFAACGGGSNDNDTETTVPDAGDEGEHTHTYSSAVTKSATCTEKGERTYTCSCGASYTEEIDINPDNHDYVPTAVEATCSSSGYTTYKCSRCGYSYTATGEPATGNHAWDDGVTTATCEAAGMTIYTCTLCGATKFEAAAALGHDWDDGVVTTAATCTAKGVKTYTCANCGETRKEDIEALGHDLQISETDATCTSGGSVTETCTRCGYMSYYLTDALGHDLVGTYCSDTSAWSYTCSRCEETFADTSIDNSLISDVTLTATDMGSIQSAVAWSGAEGAELTVVMDDDINLVSAQDNDPKGDKAIKQAATLYIGDDSGTAVDVTLDLNGNTLARNAANSSGYQYNAIEVKAGATLTVVDSSEDGSGVVDVTGNYNMAVVNYGTAILAGGLFTRSHEAGTSETVNEGDSNYTIRNYGDMTIEDGATVFNAGDYSTCIRNKGANASSPAKLTINGGKVYGGKYAVGTGDSGYNDVFVMTGGQLGGIRGEDDTLPYRALNNYCNATITGGTLLGGNGGAIDVYDGTSSTKPDQCVEGVVIFNEDTATQALTIGDEYGNGPEIIYEGVNHDAELRGDFATGIVLYSGEVDFLGGTIKCVEDTEYRPFVGAYLTDGTFNMYGGTISGLEAAIAVNAAAGSNLQVNISGGVLEGTEKIHTVTADDRALVLDRLSVPDATLDADALKFDETNSFAGYNYTIVPTVDHDGNVVYVLEGTASEMSEAVASWFGGSAAAGDAYVTLKIYVPQGETISYTSSDGEKTYTNENGSGIFDGDWLFIVWQLTGTGLTSPAEAKTFTFSDENGNVLDAVTVDFTHLTYTSIDNLMVPDATEDASDLIYKDEKSVSGGFDYTIGKTTDEDGDVTYTLYGTASTMDECLANWFGSDAQAGDAYVTVKLYVGCGNTLTYTSAGGVEQTKSDGDLTSDGYYIFVYRLSGTLEDSETAVTPSAAKTYTITDSEGNTTTVTIDYTQLAIPAAA